MKVIGLTGGIGSGKTTVSGYLKELGAVIIDADMIGHWVIEEAGVKNELLAAFGNEILDKNGLIDRKKLGDIVFGPEKEPLKLLNRLTHPRIKNIIEEELKNHRRQGVKATIVEAPLLIEAGFASLVDEIWTTTAPEEVILKRLKDKNGLTYTQIMKRIHSQLPAEERNRYADIMIDTDVSLRELKEKVNKLWRNLATRL
jgi:dephospho-CoA kinase